MSGLADDAARESRRSARMRRHRLTQDLVRDRQVLAQQAARIARIFDAAMRGVHRSARSRVHSVSSPKDQLLRFAEPIADFFGHPAIITLLWTLATRALSGGRAGTSKAGSDRASRLLRPTSGKAARASTPMRDASLEPAALGPARDEGDVRTIGLAAAAPLSASAIRPELK
ncbi:hypothetical protein ACTMU2_35015 [Cupriavidus basilensis]